MFHGQLGCEGGNTTNGAWGMLGRLKQLHWVLVAESWVEGQVPWAWTSAALGYSWESSVL